MKKTPSKKYTEILSMDELLNLDKPVVLIVVRTSVTLPDGNTSPGTSSSELFRDISEGKFTLIEEWERDWNAQPKPRTKYYAGTAGKVRSHDRKYHPVIGYSFKWVPGKGELTVWAVDNPKDTVVAILEPRTARALTNLIKKHLTGAQG